MSRPNKQADLPRRISQEVYSKDYFLSHYLEGFQEYQEGRLSATKAKQLQMLKLDPGMTLAEVGYGRGELLHHCARQGAKVAGIDYAEAAYHIARETLCDFPEADLKISDCTKLPFASNRFDRVFSGDVIEHLDHADAIQMLREMHRVLKPGGFLMVHTTPNRIFTKHVYPIVRPLLRRISPDTVQGIDHHLQESPNYHVIEYTLFSLKRIGRQAELEAPVVWIDPDLLRSADHIYTRAFGQNPLIRMAASMGVLPPVRFFLGNDLYLKSFKSR